jgi:hypothetical protein
MNELLSKYKDFWKQVKPVVDANGFTGFHITFSGCGDCGQIDEIQTFTGKRARRLTPRQVKIEMSIDTDRFGNSMRPHPWNHGTETFADLEESGLVIPNVHQKQEIFVPGEGWKIEDSVGDMPLAEVVKKMAYEVAYTWFGGWEINAGSNGSFYFYPKYIEFEFTEYFEDYDMQPGKEVQGHKCYSETVRFHEFEGWDYDEGYRGYHIDQIIDEDE